MNGKMISHNQAHAIFMALANENLWQVCAIEFPEMVEVVTRSMEQPAKRIVAIGKGDRITHVNADWLDELGGTL